MARREEYERGSRNRQEYGYGRQGNGYESQGYGGGQTQGYGSEGGRREYQECCEWLQDVL